MSTKHTCHAYDCDNACPPRHLMCRTCWDLVPPAVQAEVYRTVKLRGPSIDVSWLPWLAATRVARQAVRDARKVA